MCSSRLQSQGEDGGVQEMHGGCCRSPGAYGEVMLGPPTMCAVLSLREQWCRESRWVYL